MRFATIGAAVALLFAAPSAGAQPAHRRILADRLRAALVRIAESGPGVIGASVIDLRSGERFGVNDTLTFPQGSAIKIPILVELHRQAGSGRLRLDARADLRVADQVAGTGVLQHLGDSTSSLSLGDLATLMIVLSDNTATNILIDQVGMDRVNATMRELGVPSIRLQRKMIRPRESAAGNENLARPVDAASLMSRIARCELPVSKERCAALRRTLEIPKGGPIAASVPADVRVAWKPGEIEGVSTAWGIVDLPGAPYVVVAMVNYGDEAVAQRTIRQVADAAWEYFHVLARSTPYGVRVPGN